MPFGLTNTVAAKIKQIHDLYASLGRSHAVHKLSETRPAEFQSVVLWSDSLRQTRNAIHFGVEPTIAYNYEDVGLLFIHGSTSLKMLYRVKKAVDQLRQN